MTAPLKQVQNQTMSNFDLESFWQSERAAHIKTAEDSFAILLPQFTGALEACVKSIGNGGKMMFFGNGGSAADAQHLAAELAVRYVKDRKAIAGLALSTDASAMTATSNDIGFEHIFSRQIEALGRTGDIAIGISTSGNSPNVLRALETARSMGIVTIGLSGRDGGKLHGLCDHVLIVPSRNTARIQEIHITLGHMLCGALEQKLGLVQDI